MNPDHNKIELYKSLKTGWRLRTFHLKLKLTDTHISNASFIECGKPLAIANNTNHGRPEYVINSIKI